MTSKPAPFLIVATSALFATLLGIWIVWMALNQPWLGLKLAGEGLEEGLRIVSVAPLGPATNLKPGTVILDISDASDRHIALEPYDMAEEPDAVDSYQTLDRFFMRQQTIYDIIADGEISLTFADGSQVSLVAAPARPLNDLPMAFWIQIAVGLCGSVIGACVWALRPDMPGARALALSSVMLMLSTYPSALYLTRELALDGTFFRLLNSINPLGSLGFAVSLLILFLVYPRALVSSSIITAILILFSLWWLMDILRIGLPGPGIGRYMPTALAGLAAPVMAAVQYWASRGDPLMRAALGWFGLSLSVAIAIFILLFVTPSLLGQPPLAPQAFSYALALLVYGGIALGIARYRIFDLDRWAFRILFYVGGAMAFAALDVFLVAVIALDMLPAFGLALLIVALLYLPLRDVMARWFMPAPNGRHQIFLKVVGVALTSNSASRNQSWENLLRQVYDPLSVTVSPERSNPEIGENGLALLIPGCGFVPSLKLRHAHSGRRLFSRRDIELGDELCAMLLHSCESREAYEKGTAEERDRIARDTHDNIGAKLLSALHGTALERKDTMIREALSDLRDIINNPSGITQTLDELLAELRLETAERLSAAGLSLHWSVEGETLSGVSAEIVHALRSIIREGVSNTLRHAKAASMTISVLLHHEHLQLTISDDGRGIPAHRTNHDGLGLDGIRARLEALGGTFETASANPGFSLCAIIPCERGDTP